MMTLLLEQYPVAIGLFLRLFLAWLLPFLFDTHGVVPGVAYTDIDYHIFVDAANHVRQGNSPYDRHTYRYTPFLASLLAQLPHHDILSRFLFCVADALCGWIILRYRQQKREERQQHQQHSRIQEQQSAAAVSNRMLSPRLQDALWWLYNPLAINICTRGSSESFQVLLPVLVTVSIVTLDSNSISSQQQQQQKSWLLAIPAGVCHGVAVHSKLYPIIYSLSFMTYFAAPPIIRDSSTTAVLDNTATILYRLVSFFLSWAKRLLTPAPIVFFITFMLTFVGLTYLAYEWYGPISLEEGLLYHLSRVDHRHNYSMHWYWIYLGRARPDFAQNMAVIGKLLLLPQLVLLVYTSLALAPTNLGLALFVQTYLFVTQNKVITAQYLTWYLCLLPLCSDSFGTTPRLQWSLAGLALSYGIWLGSAYCLEMQGWAVHRLVWIASVVYYWANISVIAALLSSYQGGKTQQQQQQSKGTTTKSGKED
ncbi:GPI mannosyltransferase 1 [Seminavis robusta]|uniref:GPI mannosyltransferase 1 n=1 Tax=Seminavis robusta TaxID=568900 RepID=A0A9N8HBV5_9STRA|nr:GPI mannosyltransferase 1 [Seminavis robusta]|eukprot:Sro274_g105380.1 GPI mannosyltransferase 1 (479) ;mRNA; f:30128-31564